MSNLIDDYVKWQEEAEPPSIFKEWVAVSGICSVLQRKCWLQWGMEGRPIYPNLYVLLVGIPATRKGTAMTPMTQLLRDLEVPLGPDSCSIRALLNHFEEAQQETTIGGKPLVHCSLTIHSSEFTVLLESDDTVKMVDLLGKLYDCETRYVHSTYHTEGADLTNVWCNFIGGTTTSHITTSLPGHAIRGGLMSRCVLVYAPDKQHYNGRPVTELQAKLNTQRRYNILQGMKDLKNLKGAFEWTPEYEEAYVNWYEGQAENPSELKLDPYFEGYVERRQMHIRAVSMAYCAARKNTDMVLNIDDWNRALDLLTRTERSMRFVYSDYGDSPYHQVLMRILRIVQGRGCIPFKALFRETLRDVHDENMLKSLLRSLQTAGAIEAKVSNDTGELLIVYKDSPTPDYETPPPAPEPTEKTEQQEQQA